MIIVIFGYGSAGRRHANIIRKNFNNYKIYIYTKQKIKEYNYFSNLKTILTLKPDYVIIASENNKHFYQLQFLEKNFKGLKILVEKPLFDKFKKLNIRKNNVFVGYNLRFHPFIKNIYNLIKSNQTYDIQFITNTYLPNWRKTNFKNNYAVSKRKGGGIILDLSHELDLAKILLGEFKILYKNYGKISKLTNDTEDHLKLIGRKRNTNLSIDLKYFSRNEVRIILVDCKNFSIFADLKNSIFKVAYNNKTIVRKSKVSMYQTYLEMHKAVIMKKNFKHLCTYNEGVRLLKLINSIKIKKLNAK